jgi:hypothetical protein
VVVITVHWHDGYLDATAVAMMMVMVMVYGDSDVGDNGFDDDHDHVDDCDSDGARSHSALSRQVQSSPLHLILASPLFLYSLLSPHRSLSPSLTLTLNLS